MFSWNLVIDVAIFLCDDQSLELWNMTENKMMTRMGEPISALALSDTAGLVASASRNNLVKIWK